VCNDDFTQRVALGYLHCAPSALTSVIISEGTESFSQAVAIIARGGVIAFRTDTFYGLGADPFNCDAVQKITDLKGREEDKPILVVISDNDQVERFIAQNSVLFDLLAKRFWPGALTLVGKAAPQLPPEITAGTGTIGVRLPDDDRVRALVRACGGALTATSANPSGQEPAKRASDVMRYFGATIDLIIDAGQAQSDQPSTVVDARSAEPRLVREGAIAWPQIQAAINQFKTDSGYT